MNTRFLYYSSGVLQCSFLHAFVSFHKEVQSNKSTLDAKMFSCKNFQFSAATVGKFSGFQMSCLCSALSKLMVTPLIFAKFEAH